MSLLNTSPEELAGGIVKDITTKLDEGVYHPYNPETGVTPYWSYKTDDGRTINVTDPGTRDAGNAAERASNYVRMMDNKAAYPDDGQGYAYTDKYGFSHVGSRADAETYGVPGSVQPYSGAYGGGYALDAQGNRIMVDTPGAVPYGNDVRVKPKEQQRYEDVTMQNESVLGDSVNKKPAPLINYNYGNYNSAFEKRDKSGAKIAVADDGKVKAVSRYLAKDIWK